MTTKIQWTTETWNPLRARNLETGGIGHYCEKVSLGCAECYAERMQKRFKNKIRYNAADRDKVELFLDEKTLTAPLHWGKPRFVFPCSMTDIFGDWVTDEWLDRIFAVMAFANQHKFQVLTKRADRMLSYMQRLARNIAPLETAIRSLGYTFKFKGLDGQEHSLLPWPIPNVWLGVSVENQETTDERIPLLLETPAVIRWLSCEPLLGAIDLHKLYQGHSSPWSSSIALSATLAGGQKYHGVDWVVVGGESGPSARSFNVEWASSIIAQCKSAGVACFIKQLGAKPVDWRSGVPEAPPYEFFLNDSHGGDPSEWPEDLRVREFPV